MENKNILIQLVECCTVAIFFSLVTSASITLPWGACFIILILEILAIVAIYGRVSK